MSIYIIKPICEYDEGDCYYGSTTTMLCRRMAGHRQKYREYKIGKTHYTTIFDIFDKYGLEICEIALVEKLENFSRNEMLIKESEYILNNHCINKSNPKPLSKEDYKQKSKEYYQTVIKTNPEKKEKLKEQSKKWLEENSQGTFTCDCGGTYTYKHKSRHINSIQHKLGTDVEFKAKHEEEQKQKDEERKQREKEYKLKWYQENKDKSNV